MIITVAVYILIAENSNSSKQKHAGISHGEDCWIQTLEIDGVHGQLSRPGMSMVNSVVKPLPGLKVHLNHKNVFCLIHSMYFQYLNSEIFPVLSVALVNYRDLNLQNAFWGLGAL